MLFATLSSTPFPSVFAIQAAMARCGVAVRLAWIEPEACACFLSGAPIHTAACAGEVL
jgi:hypothetical protein